MGYWWDDPPRVYYSPNIVEKEQTRSKRERERERENKREGTRDERETCERDVCVRERWKERE